MEEKLLARIQVARSASIKDVMKRIDELGLRTVFVHDKFGRFSGMVTDGDIRRWILRTGGDIRDKISVCLNPKPIYVVEGDYDMESVKKIMIEKIITVIPVLDKNNKLADILLWKNIFGKENILYGSLKDIPLVIMAGGKGERLDPFTKILPKPLIPVGEKPVLEFILDKFHKQGMRNFYAILNYKGDMVKAYFDSIEKTYKLNFIQEKEYLGTAGGLKLLPKLGETFIVSNCDIVVDADYADLVRFHKEKNNIITIAGSIQHYRVPYGIIQFGKYGKVKNVEEKPEFDFTINTGIYVLSSRVLRFIGRSRHLDMTELIQKLITRNENVGVYPVSQKSYIDIGQWDSYRKNAIQLMQ